MFLDIVCRNHRSIVSESRKATDRDMRLEELVGGEQSGIVTGLNLADQRFVINGVSGLQLGDVLCVFGRYRGGSGDGDECPSCGPQLHGRIADLISLDKTVTDISRIGVAGDFERAQLVVWTILVCDGNRAVVYRGADFVMPGIGQRDAVGVGLRAE